LSFPPKDSIPNVTGFLRRKSAIRLHREFVGQGTTGKHFWVRGYYVSTVGYDEKQVREYIRNQEKLDKRADGVRIRVDQGPSISHRLCRWLMADILKS